MAGTLNQINIIGNVVRDPEKKNIQSGTAVCSFSIAVNRPPNKTAPEGTQTVDYFRAVAWDKMADICDKYLKKGMSIYVGGKMQMRQYTDKDGNKRESAEIVVKEMQMLGNKNESNNGAVENEGGHEEHVATVAQTSGSSNANLDDEIPF